MTSLHKTLEELQGKRTAVVHLLEKIDYAITAVEDLIEAPPKPAPAAAPALVDGKRLGMRQMMLEYARRCGSAFDAKTACADCGVNGKRQQAMSALAALRKDKLLVRVGRGKYKLAGKK